eukprot:15471072-Alexandrium_andersonii.AAC.1
MGRRPNEALKESAASRAGAKRQPTAHCPQPGAAGERVTSGAAAAAIAAAARGRNQRSGSHRGSGSRRGRNQTRSHSSQG